MDEEVPEIEELRKKGWTVKEDKEGVVFDIWNRKKRVGYYAMAKPIYKVGCIKIKWIVRRYTFRRG